MYIYIYIYVYTHNYISFMDRLILPAPASTERTRTST